MAEWQSLHASEPTKVLGCAAGCRVGRCGRAAARAGGACRLADSDAEKTRSAAMIRNLGFTGFASSRVAYDSPTLRQRARRDRGLSPPHRVGAALLAGARPRLDRQ